MRRVVATMRSGRPRAPVVLPIQARNRFAAERLALLAGVRLISAPDECGDKQPGTEPPNEISHLHYYAAERNAAWIGARKAGVVCPVGARRAAMYSASKAHKAASTLGPNPEMPSRKLRPTHAIHLPERTASFGRRTAEGVPGCAIK